MAQFVLNIEKLSHIMGPTPILEMARAYGLRPRLWLLPQPRIKVHVEIHSNFRSVLLDFQSFTEKPVFKCPFAHPMILFLSYLVKNGIFRVSVISKLAKRWYVMRKCTS